MATWQQRDDERGCGKAPVFSLYARGGGRVGEGLFLVFRALDSNEISKGALSSPREILERVRCYPSDNKECPGGVLGTTC